MRLLDDLQCAVRSGSVHISVLDGALWDAWQVRCGMGEIGLSLLLFNRSVQIVVWYLWCWDLFYVILVCTRFHVIFVSCDCIMKCIFVWTQVVNKLLLLLGLGEGGPGWNLMVVVGSGGVGLGWGLGARKQLVGRAQKPKKIIESDMITAQNQMVSDW